MMKYKVFNAHSDYAFKVLHEQRIGNSEELKDNYLPLMKKGGVQVEVFQIGGDFLIPDAGIDGRDTITCLKIIEANLTQIRANPDDFYLITRAEHLQNAKQGDRRGIIFSMEGIAALSDGPEILSIFYDLGVRTLSLTHNYKNVFADGCAEVNSKGGLSILGRKMIKKINELNMVLDLVHINSNSFYQALDVYEHVPMISHSNAKTLCDHFRNLSDDEIKAIGSRNGVIGINFISMFINENSERASVENIVEHLDYMVELIGIDHVGLGPDFIEYFANIAAYVKGMEDPTGFPLVADLLERKGYSSIDINKIMYDNFSRVFCEVLT